jgi:coenzyme F420 hydrogenase subunit beta
MKTLNIFDVAAGQMCTGCGACAYVSPDDVRMVDDLELGRRPVPRAGTSATVATPDAMTVCPGIRLEHTFDPQDPKWIEELIPGWGPILEIWEGSAADQEVRFAASSGGAATALSLYCIEQAAMHGTLHIKAREDHAYLNETTLSRSRDEMLRATGSRYAPASPCDSLAKIEEAPSPCVFIGKPCDVAAVEKARAIRPSLDRNVGLTIAIFCAGTPNTRGTLKMLEALGVEDPETVTEVRYRGNGWPGNAAATYAKAGAECHEEMTYEASWGDILQKHRQWRCYLCLDHTGEFADIAVGDPWYRDVEPGAKGESMILVRTERGREILKGAIAAGYLDVERGDPSILPGSQGHFYGVRGKIWGRLKMLRLFGAAAPRYVNMPMFRFFWRNLSFSDKVKSFVGTVRRIFRKGLRTRVSIVPFESQRSREAESDAVGAPKEQGVNS